MSKQLKPKNNKEDLHINRYSVFRVTKPNINLDDVFRFDISLYAIPTRQLDMDEYDEQVKTIKKYINHTLKKYVINNNNIFFTNSIIDISFTSANLRKGYNKSVQASMFVKTRDIYSNKDFIGRIKETIKPTIKMITDKFACEGYKCHKTKQKTNKKNIG